MFQGLPLLRAGAVAGQNPLNPLVVNAGPTIENGFAGARTVTGPASINWAATLRTTVSGATLIATSWTGLINKPAFSTVAGSTINFGTVRGLWLQEPAAGLFQPSAGIELMTAYYGLDFDAMAFGGNVSKVVVRSSLAAASNAYFLRNLGGAQSDFGTSTVFGTGNRDIRASNVGLRLGATQNVNLNWNGTAFEWDPAVGDDLRLSFAAGVHTLQSSAFGGSGAELRMGFERFAFGQVGAVGNQVGVFVANARATGVAGEWSDFLLTQAANLTVNHAMGGVFGWTVNAPSMTLGTGTVTTAGALNVGGNVNQGSVNRFGVRILSNPTGGSGVNAALWVTAGRSRFDGFVDINKPVALGAGAAATLGTIGGAGPTAAAQAQWVQIEVNGVNHWIAAWT